MALKEGDFCSVTFTAKVKETGAVFDTTDEKTAKEEHAHHAQPGPRTICLGEGFLLAGLEKRLVGKSVGKHTIDVPASEAFGMKNAKLIRLFPTNKLMQQNVMPEPGMVVNVDNHIGMIRTVGGGRTTIDFNHPLASKDVSYDIEVVSLVTDSAIKLRCLVDHYLGSSIKADVAGDKATVTLPKELPKRLADELAKKLGERTGVAVSFAVDESLAKKGHSHEGHDHAGHDHSHDGHDHAGHDHAPKEAKKAPEAKKKKGKEDLSIPAPED